MVMDSQGHTKHVRHRSLRKRTYQWIKQHCVPTLIDSGTTSLNPLNPSPSQPPLLVQSPSLTSPTHGPLHPSSSKSSNRFCFKVSDTHSYPNPIYNSTLPTIKVKLAELLGDVHSETTYVKRDLGFQGQIGLNIILTYGDTLYSDAEYSDTWRGMTSDSMALATHDPLLVYDPDLNDQGYPRQFCPLFEEYGEDSSTCAMGITNVVEIFPGEGIIYFLLNHRPNGTNNLIGAGVAKVSMTFDDNGIPTPTLNRTSQYWWNADLEPWYGDICALRWKNYIYAYGHAKDNPWIYLTRVKYEEATNLNCYEYWNGLTWQKDRLYTTDLTEKESIFWQINQGQVFYSEYFSCFLFVYCDNWMNSKILAKTSFKPEGPWSNETIELYQATPITEGSSIYAAVPHPYFDPVGNTLIVTFTNFPNLIQAVKITFE